MDSNKRNYRRRAFEERVAAQRAMTDQERAWHAKLLRRPHAHARIVRIDARRAKPLPGDLAAR